MKSRRHVIAETLGDGPNVYLSFRNEPLDFLDPEGLTVAQMLSCAGSVISDSAAILTVGDLILMGVCLAACSATTACIGTVPCTVACAAAIGGGTLAGAVYSCWEQLFW